MSIAHPVKVCLIGGGHAHALVLRRWAEQGCLSPTHSFADITLISESRFTVYSGMMTGFMAGLYRREQIEIDFEKLCGRFGVQFQLGRVIDIDRTRKLVHSDQGQRYHYHFLSLNPGSETSCPFEADSKTLSKITKLKPSNGIFALVERLDSATTPQRLVILGGGGSGVETACALAQRFRDRRQPHHITLIEEQIRLAPSASPRFSQIAFDLLKKHDVRLRLGESVSALSKHQLLSEFDEIILALSPKPRGEFTGLGLEQSQGFIHVNSRLQTSDPDIFAAGDLTWADSAQRFYPRAGVFAVRAAPVLADQIRARVQGSRSSSEFIPQKRWLSLMIDGFGRATGAWGEYTLQPNRFWWILKDQIDRRFMKQVRSVAAR